MIGILKRLRPFFCLLIIAVLTSCATQDLNESPALEKSLAIKSFSGGKIEKQGELKLLKPPNIKKLATGEDKPPTPEEAEAALETEGGNWLYGKGLGSTTLNVATCVVFPPYIIYLLANAGLEMAGYEPLHITEAVPEPARKGINEIYDDVVSVPGRVAAGAAGEDFRDR